MRKFAILCFSLLLSLYSLAQAEEPALATIYSLDGEASVIRSKGGTDVAAQGSQLFLGDAISVGRGGRVGVEFSDGTFVRLGSLATLVLEQDPATTNLRLERGAAHFLSREPIKYPTITTPTVTAAIRGTEFTINASATETLLSVIEGQVLASNAKGSTLLHSGESARAKLNEPPLKDSTISIKEASQWTVSLPLFGSWTEYQNESAAFSAALLAVEEGGLVDDRSLTEDEKLFLKVISYLRSGSVGQALRVLDVVGGSNAAILRLLRARTEIAGGEVKRGRDHLVALSTDPQIGALAKSSLALLELQLGELEAAERTFATIDAASLNLFSVVATQSLLLQAKRDFDGAFQAASMLPERNNYGIVRRSEILFSKGEIARARAMLESAEDDGYKNLVAGFVYLAAADKEEAQRSFERVVELQGNSAIARLGLGLVAVQRNDLELGRKYLLEAAQLDPHHAMIRSYLGKLFSEGGDEHLARREYGEAQRLDPNDPTPLLYRSFTNLSENKPVAALYDVQESIKLNSSRGVFRSSLLLDQDQAVRSANLSRVYRELGFFELGRIEAVKALARDARNYSAHRLLADSQETLFLADAALSDRRQADLLAPLSLNLFDSVGGAVSFGDYTGLFDRDQTKVALGAQYDSTDSLSAPSILVAGKDGRFGYAMSGEAGIYDGSASGNSNQDYRLSGLLRYQPDFDTRIGGRGFVQYIRTDDLNAAEQEEQFRRFKIELEGAQELGPTSTLLLLSGVERSKDHARSFGNEDTILSTQLFQGISDSLPDDIIFDQVRESYVTSTQHEAQILHEHALVSTTFGGIARTEHHNNSENSLVVEDALGELTGNDVQLPSASLNDLQSYGLYSYSTLHLAEWAHLVAGAAYERVERELTPLTPYVTGTDLTEKLSPKLGLLLTPTEEITLRAAFLEGVQKSSFNDQISLEPTQLSGINQRFNDLPGTKVRSVGAGIDYSLTKESHLGAEWIHRNLAEPYDLAVREFIVDFDQPEISLSNNTQIAEGGDLHLEQDLGRGYFYQVLSDHLVSAVDYRLTNQRWDDAEEFSRTTDHTVATSLRYFLDSGFFFLTRGSWRYQDRVGSLLLGDGSDAGWLFDAGVGFRFPKRQGSIALEVRNIFGQDVELEQLDGIEPYVTSDTTALVTARVVF